MDHPPLTSLDSMASRLEEALASSPADETELVWFEVSRGDAATRGRRPHLRPPRERAIRVRVHEGGRVGTHRMEVGTLGELENGIRQAIAQSRVRPPIPGLPHLPTDSARPAPLHDIFDEQVARLSRNRAQRLIRQHIQRGERAEVEWAEARVAVFNSRGLRRQTQVTTVSLRVRSGRQPGAGGARGAGRTLAALAPQKVFERARARRASGDELGELTAGPHPLVLSQEATASLCGLLNRTSFSARSYRDGSSFLREHLGVQVFDRRLNLYDDGTDAHGLPFPFDLEGTAKQRVELIRNGAAKTPALDQRQAAVLGLPATGHAITGNDAQAENLFLTPGEEDLPTLLRAAEGGLWIGDLEGVECFAPRRIQFRARAMGVRSIRDGSLGTALPDLLWEDSLLRAFSNILAFGNHPVTIALNGGVSGGVSAPAIALSEADGLSVA